MTVMSTGPTVLSTFSSGALNIRDVVEISIHA
jgi:hypothetical protein